VTERTRPYVLAAEFYRQLRDGAMRTSGGLAVTASGAILLLAVNIPLPWLSLKIVGLVIM
jgi:hypothetical protein